MGQLIHLFPQQVVELAPSESTARLLAVLDGKLVDISWERYVRSVSQEEQQLSWDRSDAESELVEASWSLRLSISTRFHHHLVGW